MKNKLKNSNVPIYLAAFLIPIVCLLIHMIIYNCYPFGSEYSILLNDLGGQYYGYYSELIDKLNEGGSLLYSFNGGLGENFYASYGYYLASPFTWLIILFGKKYLEAGIICVFMLELGLCSATMCYFFRHSSINKLPDGNKNKAFSLLFAVAFSMCDYVLAYRSNIIWLTPLMIMPFVLLGIERLVETGDKRMYLLSLFLVLVTNFYFAWFICMIAVVWFVDMDKKKEELVKSFFSFALTSILAALSAAAILIPCYYQVITSAGTSSKTLADYSITTMSTIGDFIVGMFWASDIDILGTEKFTNHNYVGVFALFLLLVYLTQKAIPLKKKIKRSGEILFFALAMSWIVGIYYLHGGSFPIGFNQRFAFIFLFLVLVSAFEALANLESIRIRHIATIFATFIALAVVALLTASPEQVQSIACYLGTVLIFAYLVICAFFYKRKSIKLSSLYINIFIIGIIEIIANSFLVYNSEAVSESEYNLAELSDWSDIYENIETSDGGRKTNNINSQILFYYSDTNAFSSTINTGVLNLYNCLGLNYSTSGRKYSYSNTTPLTAALFNVEYVLTDNLMYYGGYAGETTYTTSSGTEFGIYASQYKTAFAFMMDDSILELETEEENAFEVQNNITRDVLGVGDIFTEITDLDIETGLQNSLLTSVSYNSYKYLNMDLSGTSYPVVALKFVVDKDMDLYVELADEKLLRASVQVDEEEVMELDTYPAPTKVIHIGQVTAGQEVLIFSVGFGTETGEESTVYAYFYEYNEDVMKQCIDVMNSSIMTIETFSDTYISGTVTATSGQVLYTSIPYYKGWSAYVDGEKVQVKTVADALIALELEDGDHVVEFKYFPYGLKLGIMLTILGLILSIILWKKSQGLSEKSQEEEKALIDEQISEAV